VWTRYTNRRLLYFTFTVGATVSFHDLAIYCGTDSHIRREAAHNCLVVGTRDQCDERSHAFIVFLLSNTCLFT